MEYGYQDSSYYSNPRPSMMTQPQGPQHQYLSTLPPQSFYGSARSTFMDDGKGMHYNAPPSVVGQPALNQDISYDTSSKDPVMIRSRVFIGNIVRGPISRDDLIDLCKPFGKLLALTFFQGYAFVQFSEAIDADSACAGLNGKRWKGAVIDVHLAMSGPGSKKKSEQAASSTFDSSSRKRRYDDPRSGTTTTDSSVLDETAEQNKRNREYANQDTTTNSDLVDTTMADTLICGSCRFVTCDFEVYKDHRVAGCRNIKDSDEPKSIRCATCNVRFLTAWALVCHITDVHRMMLYRDDNMEGDKPAVATKSQFADKLADESSPHKLPRTTFSDSPASRFLSGGASFIPGGLDTSFNNSFTAEPPTGAPAVPIGSEASVSKSSSRAPTPPAAEQAEIAPVGDSWDPLKGLGILFDLTNQQEHLDN